MTKSTRHLIKVLPDKKAFFCESDQRVLDAGLDAGLSLPHSCRGGNCGRCAVRVLSGDYTYDRTTPPPGLTAEQRAAGMALLCQIIPNGPLAIETAKSQAAGAAPVVKLPCRIVQREAVAPDVMKLTLQLPRTQPMDFRPGQYLDVLLDKGQRRSYSLACLPYSLVGDTEAAGDQQSARSAASCLELHVRRVQDGLFSDIAFDQNEHSSLLRIEGPFGTFGWQKYDGPALMIAGGTGYAPIKAMLLEAMSRDGMHPVHLFWGARNRQDLYEIEQLKLWQQRFDWLFVTLVTESGQNEDILVAGRVGDVALSRFEQLEDAMVYVSGPPGLVQSVVDACLGKGVDKQRLVTDSFDYAC